MTSRDNYNGHAACVLPVRRAVRFGVIAAVYALLPIVAGAQNQKPRVEAIGNVTPTALPPGGPAPRDIDGRVDLSGVWFLGSFGQASVWSTVIEAPIKEDPVPFQAWAASKIKAMTTTDLQLNSPSVNCMPKGRRPFMLYPAAP